MQNPLTNSKFIPFTGVCQDAKAEQADTSLLAQELRAIFAALPDDELLRRLKTLRWTGRPGYEIKALWHAFLAQYYLDLPNMNSLIRRLQDDPYLVEVCGFDMDKPLPERWTFNRFFSNLSGRWILAESCFNRIVDELHNKLRGFGELVAVDSTIIESWSNPNATPVSDGEAHWAHRKDAQGKTVAIWGYKAHVVSDARYELPLGMIVTPGNINDTTQLIPLFYKLKALFPWFSPKQVIADAGYDSGSNYEFIASELRAIPIIKMRKESLKWSSPDISDYEGTPHCIAGFPFVFWGYDKKKGLKWRCPEKTGKSTCPIFGGCGASIIWIQPSQDYRRFCTIPRASNRWKLAYDNRQAAERIFSRLKEHRRLDDHCFRGIDKLTLHCLMAALVMEGVALGKVRARKQKELRTCVRKIG